MGDCGLFGAARTGTAPLHAVPARAWDEAAACRKDGGAVVTRMRAGSTSLLMLPAWLLRKLDAEALARLLDDGTGDAAAVEAPPPPAAQGPSPRQLARRARRKRQRARKRATVDDDPDDAHGVGGVRAGVHARADAADAGGVSSADTGDDGACDALPSDDVMDGGMSDASRACGSSVVCTSMAAASAPAAAGSSGRKRAASAPAPAQLVARPTSRGAAVNGAGSPAARAAGSAAQQKRRRQEGGSAEGAGVARGPHVSAEELDRLSALSETLRQELSSNGVPDDQLLSRSIQFGGKSLPNFTVVRSGQWAKLSAASLAEAVLYLLRDESCPPFEGLRNAMVKGSYYFELAKSS